MQAVILGIQRLGLNKQTRVPCGADDFLRLATGFDQRVGDLQIDVVHYFVHHAHRGRRGDAAAIRPFDGFDAGVAQRIIDLRTTAMHQNNVHAVLAQEFYLPRDLGEKMFIFGDGIAADFNHDDAVMIGFELFHQLGDLLEGRVALHESPLVVSGVFIKHLAQRKENLVDGKIG